MSSRLYSYSLHNLSCGVLNHQQVEDPNVLELDQHFKMKNDINQMKTDSEWTIMFE